MTKDEAIELLEDLDGAIEDNHGRDYDEAFRMAIESLSADSVRFEVYRDIYEKYIDLKHKTEWIPVSKRLPKIGKQVLCCDSQSRVFTSALTEIASNGMTFFGQHCKVIAWMPLPKPYKEENEE